MTDDGWTSRVPVGEPEPQWPEPEDFDDDALFLPDESAGDDDAKSGGVVSFLLGDLQSESAETPRFPIAAVAARGLAATALFGTLIACGALHWLLAWAIMTLALVISVFAAYAILGEHDNSVGSHLSGMPGLSAIWVGYALSYGIWPFWAYQLQGLASGRWQAWALGTALCLPLGALAVTLISRSADTACLAIIWAGSVLGALLLFDGYFGLLRALFDADFMDLLPYGALAFWGIVLLFPLWRLLARQLLRLWWWMDGKRVG